MNVITLVMLLSLPNSATDQGQRIADAYKFGDVVAAASYLSTIASRDPRSLLAVSQELQKHRLPPAPQLLVDARLTAAKNGQAARLPRITVPEMCLVGSGLVAHIDSELAAVQSELILKETPTALADYHDAFWTLNSASNRMHELHAVTSYWKTVTMRFPRRSLSELPESIRGRVEAASGAATHEQVEQLLTRLDRREMELRLARLLLSVDALQQESDLVRRILAAGYWREDYETLKKFVVAPAQPDFRVAGLSQPELRTLIDKKADLTRELAGELTAKSESLNQALFWWVRGRYAIGTELFGLAKPAVANQRGDLSQIIMPAERPEPTAAQAYGPAPVPQFARRHHFSWAVGPRNFGYSVGFKEQVHQVPVLKGFRLRPAYLRRRVRRYSESRPATRPAGPTPRPPTGCWLH